MSYIRLFFIALAAYVFAGMSFAQAEDANLPPYPRDINQVEVFLGTRDIGHPIYSKYGHTIVRILDRGNSTDIGYNWGTFNFNDPAFVPNFMRGILIYYMSYGPWRDEVAISRLERQTMWMERVNLTAAQKQRLIDRIFWHARPENVHYPYYFFYDNCSTRVRDLFDLAVGGQIKARSTLRMSGKTYRDRVMEHNESAPFFAMGQDILLNSEPDKLMSEWDDMFIPGRLRDYLRVMPAFDDAGQEIPGLTFLSETRTLTQFPRPEIPWINGYLLMWILCGVPTICGLLMSSKRSQMSTAYRMIGLSGALLGALWGFLGIFLTASWAFGSHTVLPHNANLWMIWPTDIVYLLAGMMMMVRGKGIDPNTKFGQWLKTITMLHLVGIGILVLLTLSQTITQQTTRVVFWFAPLTALCWTAICWPAICWPTLNWLPDKRRSPPV
jgi:hypothetical protein